MGQPIAGGYPGLLLMAISPIIRFPDLQDRIGGVRSGTLRPEPGR